ncbi:NADP oxidoreductase [Micromonospora cathayae]|uniref:NADP oxidoreductase n=1 Tax=Micromonospora cathayae TaxID=3028804 RepID=A0ABY7ZKZ6_9ACTN|nr:NADP oxidoreductase [Micromonospora sp. HUAS 3]WDZ83446.1 NADP oxidoreductase [Micromonospora sp. HUAS 3]
MNRYRFAVVGAGPAGAYTTSALLTGTAAAGVPAQVDLLDRLPTPWGLVRSGVAPDHPQTRSVTRVFERVVDHPDARFLGGIEIGRDLTHHDLLELYDAVVYATGAPDDRPLAVPGAEPPVAVPGVDLPRAVPGVDLPRAVPGVDLPRAVPGVDLPGSLAAGRFVRWYNGHPDAADERIVLDHHRAVVVGNGNVALDCARLLVRDPTELARTDIADPALAAFTDSRIREVVVLGRRHPARAAFTLPELAELGRLTGVDVVVDAPDLAGDGPVLDALRDLAARPVHPGRRRLVLRFQVSPVALVGERRVTALDLVHNDIVDGRVQPTGRTERLDCGLVVHAVGFRGRPLPGVPFDERHGHVAHTAGRVAPRVYVAGWAKRGPSGVVGTNRKCATETVAGVLADLADGTLRAGGHDPDKTLAQLRDRCPDLVTLDGWRRIDAAELAAGAAQGRPRVRFTTTAALLAAARGPGSAPDPSPRRR